jgi:glutamate synthase domain-containing protein 2
MSKMGISTYQSYCGAQIFDAVGLSSELRRQVLHRHRHDHRRHRPVRGRRGNGAPPRTPSATTRSRDMLDVGGEYAFRMRGEEHMWTPDASPSCSTGARQVRDTYKEFAASINDQSERC